MESGDEMMPRGVPKPASFQENFNKPEVPEVSLIFDSKSPFEKKTEKKADEKPVEEPAKTLPDLAPISESYNVWRYKNAHLLDIVSSRANSFQPAPVYNGSPSENGPRTFDAAGEPSFKPAQQGNFQNGESHPYNGVPATNGPSTFNPSSETYKPTQQNNLASHNKFYNPSSPSNRHIHSPPSTVNLNTDPSRPTNFVMSQEKNYSPTGRGPPLEDRHLSPSRNYPYVMDSQSNRIAPYEDSRGIPSRNYPAMTDSRSTPLEERRGSPSRNHAGTVDSRNALPTKRHQSPLRNHDANFGHQNGYQMNYVHFSSVTAPVSNGMSADALTNGYGQNHAATNESRRNCREIQHYSNGLPPQLPPEPVVANHGNCVVNNPYQMTNGYATKNTERKVSFEEPPSNTFHSVSPCKCETCVQKMYSKAARMGPTPSQYLTRNVELHQNVSRQIVAASPGLPNDRQKTKKISTSDLYQIVQNQNEQLTLLREKVDKLLSEKTAPVIVHHCACSVRDSPRKSNRTIAIQVDSEDSDSDRRSIGVMTSFHGKENESPQPRKTPSPTENKDSGSTGCPCACGCRKSPNREGSSSGNRQESRGGQSRKSSPDASPFSLEKNEVSLTLNAANLPPVPEQIPSPEPSVHVEMQDYHSSSDDESIESVKQNTDNRNQNGKPNGWTFYDNVIGQVNNILQNSQETTTHSQPMPKDPISAIRQTTLEQLQKMGISVFDDKNACEKRMGYEPPPCSRFNHQPVPNKYDGRESDLSLHMNQLAMKYLNKDQFANAVGIQQDIAVCNMNGGTNLSFTTLRYLERYHLMPAEFKQNMPPGPGRNCHAEENFNHFQHQFQNEPLHNISPPQPITNKILDITALRQLPKLP